LFTLNTKRDLLARLVKKVSKLDQVLSKTDQVLPKHEDQRKELNMIKYVAVTEICVLIISAIICMTLAVDSWGRVIGYFQETLLWMPNLLSIVILSHLLGYTSYVHHRLAILNMVIVTVFKEEGLGIVLPVPKKCRLRGAFKPTHCVPVYPKAKQSYTSSQINTFLY
jgi:hypothetical protein